MEKLLNEISVPGRIGYSLPRLDIEERHLNDLIPDKYLSDTKPSLPEVSEPEVARHFINISVTNHHIDKGFYPLGSCTMKYNPKINEAVARLSGFANIHPHQPLSTVQSALQMLYELEQMLCGFTGLDSFTLQPAAGSQGELTGIMMMRKYHTDNGNPRTKVLIPDSAHGTNPASVVISGYESMPVKSDDRGLVDVNDLKSKLDENVAGMMITNPNTLGLFEERILEISRMIHDVGALLYIDGANFNALISQMKPAEMGFDIIHLNLHKTFSTPHGGGGPGSGPVGVVSKLDKYLPIPKVQKNTESYTLSYDYPDSIGRIHGFYGNFGVLVRAFTYIKLMGVDGFKSASTNAIINANYLKSLVKDKYDIPFAQHCMHEFVASAEAQKKRGVKAGDIAKRLLDFGVHAPTVYFPLIVKEALMIEPTESESKATLEDFASILKQIDEEIDSDPQKVLDAPFDTPVRKLDEATAVRQLRLTWDAVE